MTVIAPKSNGALDGQTVPIPQPPLHFLDFGTNASDVDPHAFNASYDRLAALYGPIFAVQLKARIVVCSSRDLCHEISDETRFHKVSLICFVYSYSPAADALAGHQPQLERGSEYAS